MTRGNDPLQRGDLTQIQGYAYVENNPIIYVDPLGLYNVKTGEIEKDDKEEDIVNAVNEAYGIETDWETISDVSFFQDDYGTSKASELVGQKTNVGTDYVTDVTEKLDSLNADRAKYTYCI